MDEKTRKQLVAGILNDDDNAVREIISACFEAEYSRAMSNAQQVFFESIGTMAKKQA